MARKKPIPRSARKDINRGTLRSRDDTSKKHISWIDGYRCSYYVLL